MPKLIYISLAGRGAILYRTCDTFRIVTVRDQMSCPHGDVAVAPFASAHRDEMFIAIGRPHTITAAPPGARCARILGDVAPTERDNSFYAVL